MELKFHKVTALPSTLESNAIYAVREGSSNCEFYVVNSAGTLARKVSSDVTFQGIRETRYVANLGPLPVRNVTGNLIPLSTAVSSSTLFSTVGSSLSATVDGVYSFDFNIPVNIYEMTSRNICLRFSVQRVVSGGGSIQIAETVCGGIRAPLRESLSTSNLAVARTYPVRITSQIEDIKANDVISLVFVSESNVNRDRIRIGIPATEGIVIHKYEGNTGGTGGGGTGSSSSQFEQASRSAIDANYMYFGFDDTAWVIRRVSRDYGTAGIAEMTTNTGYSTFATAWAARSSLVYT